MTPPPLPLHIFAQQVMALALQEGGTTAADWPHWLGQLPGLADVEIGRLDAVVAYMIDTGILHSDQGLLGMGAEGERRFGRKHFLELLSVFVSPPLVKVFHGRQEIGEVHQSTFMVKQDGPTVLTLGGRAWRAKHIDWPRRIAYVEPTDERGRSRWLSAGQPLRFALCQAMTRVLAREDHPVRFSRRALDFMQGLRERCPWVTPEHSALVRHGDGAVRWWNFAGKLANAALGHALRGQAGKVQPDNLSIDFGGSVDLDDLRAAIQRALDERIDGLSAPLDEDFVAELKFAVCLPSDVRQRLLAARYDVREELDRMAKYPMALVRLSG